jgi:multicomponent K+:H+ antiporter subunit G
VNQAPDLPAWAALIIGLLVIAGALVALLKAIGLVRMKSFYERVHPPTMGSSMGVGLIALASMICFSVLLGRVSVQILIVVFITLTTLGTFRLLGRAALYRDRNGGDEDVPSAEEVSGMTTAGLAHQAFDRGATLSSHRPSGPAPHARDW